VLPAARAFLDRFHIEQEAQRGGELAAGLTACELVLLPVTKCHETIKTG